MFEEMNKVAIGATLPLYPSDPPFHPSGSYPELRFEQRSSKPNFVYDLVRSLIHDLGMDASRYGSKDWNPLRGIVQPGHTVVIKPNFVLHQNHSGGDIFASVTHPSVLRAIVDYVYLALGAVGRIIIADAPQMDCDWDVLMRHERLDAICEFYHSALGFELETYDLRSFAVVDSSRLAYSGNRKPLPGDPAGSALVDLGDLSLFRGLPAANLYGADYDRSETRRCHEGGKHIYSISKTVLSSDTYISVPKMKVHKKVGVTLNLKGLVGISTNKNCLIHYRIGTPRDGGDQLPDSTSSTDRLLMKAQRWFSDRTLARRQAVQDHLYEIALAGYRKLIKPLHSLDARTKTTDAGNWYGNDSAWRMTADLARIITYADREGRLHSTPQRRTFSVIDGIVGGEDAGPLAPTPRRAGCMLAGQNLFAVDMTAARCMGFDVTKIGQFQTAFDPTSPFCFDLRRDLAVTFDGQALPSFHDDAMAQPIYGFKPHFGWRGHIEVSGDQQNGSPAR
jgi:uncharacterized protein (DUF362 family)